MSLSSDFTDEPLKFMGSHSLYMPGTIDEGGSINFTSAKYSALINTKTIKMDTTPVQAAWKQHFRPSHVKLWLRQSHAYEDGGTGTAEMNRAVYNQAAVSQGAGAKDAARYAKSAQKGTGEYISKKDWFYCYFLPYSQGRYVYTTLGSDCDYFFTATMNGCSFMASGNPMKPVVTHVNTMEAADTLPGAVVTKATIRGRYADKVNMGPSNTRNAALLGKYKAGEATPAVGMTVGFKGSTQKYKLDPTEIAGLTSPDIVHESDGSLAADINCFVVGIRGKNGWEFYYQRSATVKTRFTKVTRTAADYSDLNAAQKMALRFNVKGMYYESSKSDVAVLNHSLTPCQRLNFPAGVA
jgi:hypothetical protein